MKITSTPIDDLLLIEPKVFGDERGYFLESYNQEKLNAVLGSIAFVQDNESLSSKGVLRGLHFQKPPFVQAKLIRCIQGEVLDVAVDLRKESKTFGNHFSVKLSGENKKVDNTYAPTHESGIFWNDPTLGIDWVLPETDLIISEKDQGLTPLSSTEIPF